MKTHRYFITLWLVAAITLSFAACSSDNDAPEPDPEPIPKSYFEIEKQGYSISSKAQAFDVNVRTNISGIKPAILNDKDKEWIGIIVTKQEKDNLTYQVSVKENTNSEERVGSIVFQNSKGDLLSGLNTIVITQAGADP